MQAARIDQGARRPSASELMAATALRARSVTWSASLRGQLRSLLWVRQEIEREGESFSSNLDSCNTGRPGRYRPSSRALAAIEV